MKLEINGVMTKGWKLSKTGKGIGKVFDLYNDNEFPIGSTVENILIYKDREVYELSNVKIFKNHNVYTLMSESVNKL